MKNYMVLTNPEDIPGKGFIVNDKLQRTFCKCGFVESEIFAECPICGNKEFISSRGLSETYLKIDDGILYLETKRTHYDVVRNQSVKTRVVSKVRYETNKMIHVSNCDAEKYFYDPMIDQFPAIKVSRYLFEKLPKVYNSWFVFNRFCNAVETAYGKISEQLIDEILNEFGDKNLFMKIDYASSYSRSIKDVVTELQGMQVLDRLLCDCPQVFRGQLLARKYSLKKIEQNIKSIIYAYWNGNYISGDACDRHIAIFDKLDISPNDVDAMIKYYKDNYVNMNNHDVTSVAFANWLKNNPLGTFKDFNLEQNLNVLDKQYGSKLVSKCTDDIYDNAAQFFIGLAKQI